MDSIILALTNAKTTIEGFSLTIANLIWNTPTIVPIGTNALKFLLQFVPYPFMILLFIELIYASFHLVLWLIYVVKLIIGGWI